MIDVGRTVTMLVSEQNTVREGTSELQLFKEKTT
jgi:hypothetical protein